MRLDPPDKFDRILGFINGFAYKNTFSGSKAELTIYLTQGGVFDSAEPPATIDPDGYGTMMVQFFSCHAGRITYDIQSLGLMGEIPIQRIVEDNVTLCEALR